MQAVITAGGKGTRVASVKSNIPKPMLPVCGKPVLQHQIECLKRQGISDITLTIGHLGAQIRDYFGRGQKFGVRITYVQEETPLGTAGALYYLRERITEDFILINGDLIFDVDLEKMMAFHKKNQSVATLLVHPNDHPCDSGIISIGNSGIVTGWISKEEERGWYHNCVNAGIHILSPTLLNQVTSLKRMDLDRDILKPLIPKGQIYAYCSPEYVKDMGTPERIIQVEKDLKAGLVQRKNLSKKQKAIFLDRDGTINQYVGFLRRIEDFQLINGATEAIRCINQSGYLAIVVTNQPVIARGEVTWEELDLIHCKMETLLGEGGAYIDDIFVCPHHPDIGFLGEVVAYKKECDCRKPKPGLLLRAAEKYNIDIEESWMIGDSYSDIQAGQAAGCRTATVSKEVNLLSVIKRIQEDADNNVDKIQRDKPELALG